MFGSARTAPEDPIYVLARDLARQLATDGWMIVTGAGPGIMAAGTEGAGRDLSFGVNIRLPHEQGANAFIAQDPKLVEMRYFFTRKLMLIKESHAYVVLPGGFGTLDECFELLTLLQTGKAEPAPVVLVETPGRGVLARVAALRRGGGGRARLRLGPRPRVLPDRRRASTRRARRSSGYYRNYHSARWVGDLLVLRLARLPDDAALVALSDAVQRHHDVGQDPSDPAAAPRALRRRPPRPRAGGAAVRQGELRAAARSSSTRSTSTEAPTARRRRPARSEGGCLLEGSPALG